MLQQEFHKFKLMYHDLTIDFINRTDLQTLKLENDNLLIEKNEVGLRLNQVKTDALEKEVRLNNELQKFKQELRQKEDEFKVRLEEMGKSNAKIVAIMEVRLTFAAFWATLF